MRVRVDGVDEAVAASYALRRVDKELRRDMTRNIRAIVNPVWKGAVSDRVSSAVDSAVLAKGARVAAGARPRIVAATSRRPMRGGMIPRDHWQGFEFGTYGRRNHKRTYRRRSPNGGMHDVTRHTARQMPRKFRNGRVLYDALGEVGPRVFSLWAQTAIRMTLEALEGRR